MPRLPIYTDPLPTMIKLKEYDACLDSVPIEYFTTGPNLFDHDLPSLSVFDDDPLSQSKMPKRPPKTVESQELKVAEVAKRKICRKKIYVQCLMMKMRMLSVLMLIGICMIHCQIITRVA